MKTVRVNPDGWACRDNEEAEDGWEEYEGPTVLLGGCDCCADNKALPWLTDDELKDAVSELRIAQGILNDEQYRRWRSRVTHPSPATPSDSESPTSDS